MLTNTAFDSEHEHTCRVNVNLPQNPYFYSITVLFPSFHQIFQPFGISVNGSDEERDLNFQMEFWLNEWFGEIEIEKYYF